MAGYEEMTREELLHELRQREQARNASSEEASGRLFLQHELQVHQIELEMQNRELRETHQLLEESRSRYADLYDFAPVGYCTLDRLGRVIEINLTGANMLGRERVRIVGLPLASMIGEEGGRAIRAHLRYCIDGQRRIENKIPARTREGRKIVVQAVSVPHLDAANGETVYRTILVDVTELERAQAALRWISDASARLQQHFDGPSLLTALTAIAVPQFADYCAVDLIEANEPVRHVDTGEVEGAEGGLGRRADTFFGLQQALSEALERGQARLLTERGPPGSSPRIENPRSAIVVALKVQGRVLGAVTFVVSSERPAYAAEELRVAEELAGRAALALEHARLFRDARMALETAKREHERAEEANRAKDDFLATISHELRTPLTAVLGWTRMLRAGVLSGDRWPRALETIERNARSQVELIGDLLDTARIVAGKAQLEPGNVDFVAEVETALESVRPFAYAKAIRIETSLDSTVGLIDGDPVRLQQAVSNLLNNAIKFTPQGGSVRVDLRTRDEWVELSIADTGIGIEPGFLPHVFDRFRQAEISASRTHNGLGLGLAIVRHFVELHGGSVEASSDGSNRGATFLVRLPRTELRRGSIPPPPARSPTLPDGTPLLGITVLVVDDDGDTREMLASVLEESGANVTAVGSSGEAIDALSVIRPQVIVSDIGMPYEDGHALLHQVRSLSADAGGNLPVVAVTAYASPDDRSRALHAGFTAYLAMPLEPWSLVAVIADLARQRRSQRPPA